MSTKGLWAATLVLFCAGGCAQTLSPAERLADEAAVKISQGNRTDAETALNQAIAMNPNLPWPHYNLATCLHSRRAFADALASYRRALDLFGPADRHARSACLYGIASVLDDQNAFGPAATAYEAYLEFAGAAPDEANGVTMARARVVTLKLAVASGLPPGKPLRATLSPASAPATDPAPAPEVVAPVPAPPPVPAAAPAAPAKDPAAAPAKGKPKKAKGKPKKAKGKPAKTK